MMMHWAAHLIGKPWAPGGEGPHAFDCRGLVRHVWRTRLGRDVPPLLPEVMHSPRGVIQAALDAGLRPIGRGVEMQRQAEDMDIVMMTSTAGPHVGVMVRDGAALRLLHAVGGLGVDGRAHGEVYADTLPRAAERGFGRFLVWRLVADDERAAA